MKKFYIGALAMSSLLAASCAKDNDNIPANEPTSIEENQALETGALSIKAEIQPWQEDESFRTLGWDIADASASNESIIPKVKYTQEEFNGEFAPGENVSSGQTARYYIGDNRIDPQYTEVSIKLRRPYRNLAGNIQGTPAQLRYTVWNNRDYASGIQGGLGKVDVSEGANGKQNIEIYLPMAQQTGLLFDGDWFISIALGGHAGGQNHEEGMYQYYTPSANATLNSIIPEGNRGAYTQSGVGPWNGRYNTGGSNFGWHPALTEPNRYEFPAKAEAATYFGNLASGTNPELVEVLRRGIGLKEQRGNTTAMKRHFPMISRFYKISADKRNQYAATGKNKTNYGQTSGIVIEPRGTILAFKVKNPLSVPIRVQSITGNHGGKLEEYQATQDITNGAVTIAPRTYKSISYQGFYVTGFVVSNPNQANVTNEGRAAGGFPEADMKASKQVPFVGMTRGPETFPLIAQDGTQGIVLQPGEETIGRFYLWFTAEPGAILKVRMTYDVLNPDGSVAQSNLVSEPQTVNPTTKPGFQFQDGKVYGALVQVKPNNPNN
ncbi:MAG: hypothetical protein SPK09_07660 [Porphyromonas sp.]|nr:hypothetical protein [Porphyromonas sp.]